ncbi:MAG: clan AA aspartic protease [Bacteroidota bacterium]
MGLVYADLEIINTIDIALAKKSIIGEEEIKSLRVNALVNTGAYNMCINEIIQSQLELPFVEKRTGVLANGEIETYDLVGPLTIKFKNRTTICNALVLPGNNEVLLGAIPMEDMDVIIDPKKQTLEVNPEHPYFAQMKLK